ncbi:hypothetical protein L211DRAFT_846122 [Terfezia boudieri ATCC MYA-4762]|uniref:Uncharacterized protein n=1 Tax=Terfezia boudieri ATCC MYA-4762 TaxID=1051890 RepID=A0A3N4M0C5_9PEZI|nr:hypothetical protein L211DRAFT_846122 [Terfezia boudieri ATCC MYA-4762]
MSSSDPVEAFSKMTTNDAGEDFLIAQFTQFLKLHKILTYDYSDECNPYGTLLNCRLKEGKVSELIKKIVAGWMNQGITKMSDLELANGTPLEEVLPMIKKLVEDTLILMGHIKKP